MHSGHTLLFSFFTFLLTCSIVNAQQKKWFLYRINYLLMLINFLSLIQFVILFYQMFEKIILFFVDFVIPQMQLYNLEGISCDKAYTMRNILKISLWSCSNSLLIKKFHFYQQRYLVFTLHKLCFEEGRNAFLKTLHKVLNIDFMIKRKSISHRTEFRPKPILKYASFLATF